MTDLVTEAAPGYPCAMTSYPLVPFQGSKMRIERAHYRLGVFREFEGSGPSPEHPGSVLRGFVRDLRAALDSMIVDIARVKSKDPEDVRFPFAESRARLADIIAVDIRRIDEDLADHVGTLRPWKGGNRPLYLLYELDTDESRTAVVLAEGRPLFPPDHALLPGDAVLPVMERLFETAADTVQGLGARFGRRA